MMKAKWILFFTVIGISLLVSGYSVYALTIQGASSNNTEVEVTELDGASSLECDSIGQIGTDAMDCERGDVIDLIGIDTVDCGRGGGIDLLGTDALDCGHGDVIDLLGSDAMDCGRGGVKEECVPEIFDETDGYTDRLIFGSVESASGHVPFSIALPHALPESAEQISVTVFPGHPLSQWLIRGVGIDYKFEVDDESFRSLYGGYAYIMLTQTDLLSYMPTYLEEWYDSAPSLSYVEGVARETAQIAVNGAEAVLIAYNYQVLLGLEPAPDDYFINADIYWCKDGVSFYLHVSAPGGAFTYEELIALAESVR